jgi:gamma-glutamyltranspeptidase/glutathione hydrolase
MSFGVMGGSIQAQAHTQVMVRFTDYRQNPQAASDAPRWRLGDQMNVQIEHDVPAAIIDELKSRGHRTIRSGRLATEFGRGQFIFKLDDGYFAASEKRTDGQAVGF